MSEYVTEHTSDRPHVKTNVGAYVRTHVGTNGRFDGIRSVRKHVRTHIRTRFDARARVRSTCCKVCQSTCHMLDLTAGQISEHMPERMSDHIPEHSFPPFMLDYVTKDIPRMQSVNICALPSSKSPFKVTITHSKATWAESRLGTARDHNSHDSAKKQTHPRPRFPCCQRFVHFLAFALWQLPSCGSGCKLSCVGCSAKVHNWDFFANSPLTVCFFYCHLQADSIQDGTNAFYLRHVF